MSRFSFFIIALLFPLFGRSWGFVAHKTINYAAVYTLPKELFTFYRAHIDYIELNAVKADMRRYINIDEAKRHYLDCDHYEKAAPLDTIPRDWKKALELYGEDELNEHGIVPWHLIKLKYYLTRAFAERDYPQILKLSADIGHYTGDLHVPLHSTANYNGQLTGQEGIHGLWESRLVELNKNEYNLFTGSAKYSDNLESQIWDRFEESFSAKDTVLWAEIQATEFVGLHKKYAYETRGGAVVKTYSTKFCERYDQLLNGMVQRRLRASIELLGTIWTTAWIDAGQPDLCYGVDNIEYKEEVSDSVIHQHKILGRHETH